MEPMNPRPPDVTRVTVDRPAMRLDLTFDDGTDGSIDLMSLRLHCPCATCRALRQRGSAVWPAAGAVEAQLGLRSAELVGAWGLGVTWDDGHSTGIYPFESLHEWLRTGEPPALPDSGLGA